MSAAELERLVEAHVRAVHDWAARTRAPVGDVRRALADMASQARAELDRRVAARGIGPTEAAAIAARLVALPDAESARYAPARAGVGSVFANAAASAKVAPTAARAATLLVHCPACGAPQERAADFTCRYCAAAMG